MCAVEVLVSVALIRSASMACCWAQRRYSSDSLAWNWASEKEELHDYGGRSINKETELKLSSESPSIGHLYKGDLRRAQFGCFLNRGARFTLEVFHASRGIGFEGGCHAAVRWRAGR